MTGIVVPKVKKTKTGELKDSTEPRVITSQELEADDTLLLKFTIPGNPNTKKTSQQAFGAGAHKIVLPSAQFLRYESRCRPFCYEVWKDKNNIPMNFGIKIILRIYLESWRIGDQNGYMQSIGDILEKHKVIANDMFIHWGDPGKHWLEIDRTNPRAEIEIYRYKHPYEDFRKQKDEELIQKTARAEARSLKQIKVTNKNE